MNLNFQKHPAPCEFGKKNGDAISPCICPASTTNYSQSSHYHCWDQESPACNINLANHTKCCLCDKQTSSEWKEEKVEVATHYNRISHKVTKVTANGVEIPFEQVAGGVRILSLSPSTLNGKVDHEHWRCERDNIDCSPSTPSSTEGWWNRKEMEKKLQEQVTTLIRLTEMMPPKSAAELFAITIPNLVTFMYEELSQRTAQAREEGETYWKNEAKRYAQNSDFWREKAEQARLTALQEALGVKPEEKDHQCHEDGGVWCATQAEVDGHNEAIRDFHASITRLIEEAKK